MRRKSDNPEVLEVPEVRIGLDFVNQNEGAIFMWALKSNVTSVIEEVRNPFSIMLLGRKAVKSLMERDYPQEEVFAYAALCAVNLRGIGEFNLNRPRAGGRGSKLIVAGVAEKEVRIAIRDSVGELHKNLGLGFDPKNADTTRIALAKAGSSGLAHACVLDLNRQTPPSYGLDELLVEFSGMFIPEK